MRDAASVVAARAMVRAMRSPLPGAPEGESAQPSDPTLPMRSRARRSSGWKMTTRASRPTTAPVCMMPESSRRSSAWART